MPILCGDANVLVNTNRTLTLQHKTNKHQGNEEIIVLSN